MKKRALFIFAIVTIVIVSIITLIAFCTSSGGELEQIRTAMIDKDIDPKYAETAESYHRNPRDTFQGALGENIEKVVPFGLALLSMYQLDNTKTKYLEDVEDLIKKIDKKLGDPIRDEKYVPWGSNWYHCSISLNRMLAIYEYIGNDKGVMDICHNRIIQITPRLDRSLGAEFKGKVNIIHVAIPRLLTLKKNKPDQYKKEITSGSFDNVKEITNLKPSTDNVLKDGIYQDYSCINNENIPTFSAITGLGGFSLEVYHSLGLEENITTFVTEIFNRILHPELDFIPYGLMGRGPRITVKTGWVNYRRNKSNNVNIFPFIGLGVFKSEKFVFSVRVQRDKIAAYEFDCWYQQFALGWIQMRKLYHTEIDYRKYESTMEWEQLKIQPGVISFVEENNNSFEAFKDKKKRSTYTLAEFCSEIKSYIGHLKNDQDRKLLYWFNKYKFKAFYGDKVEISERGVCTDNGLVMRYEIENKSGKELKLIVKDPDIGNKMKFKPSVDDSGRGINIPNSGEPKIVEWYQVFDENIEPKTVEGDSANNSMSFTFEGDKYSIEPYNEYHVVKCRDKIILAGNSSSLREERISHYDTTNQKYIPFKRDSNTFMYVPDRN